MVRWVPHQKMLVDSLTKLDPLKANDALHQFLRSGWLSLVDVQEELTCRKTDPAYKRRSHHASQQRLLSEYQQQLTEFLSLLINDKLGGMSNLSVGHHSID